jgi:hypothetical protein
MICLVGHNPPMVQPSLFEGVRISPISTRWGSWVLFACLLVLFFSSAIAPVPALAAHEESVEARGVAPAAGTKDLGREQALADAFRQAVRQAVGMVVQSESLVRNQILVTDQVLSRSSGFIRKYSIVSEGEADGVYSVNIRAQVSALKLRKALDAIGLTVHQMGKPRIMLLVTETNGAAKPGSPALNPWGDGVVETRIHDLLIAKGFVFADRRTVVAALRDDPSLPEKLSATLPGELIAKLASSGDAEVVFLGSAVSRSTQATIEGTRMHPCQATVSVKAVNADSGEVIASHTAQGVAPHVNASAGEAEALRRAADEVAERLSQQILQNWKGKVEGTRTVRLVVSGLSGYDDLKEFQLALRENVEEVEEVWERSFEARTANLDVEIASSSRNLADQLSTLSVLGRPVKISSFTSNVVQLSLGTKKGASK